jgi:hypothetical protein
MYYRNDLALTPSQFKNAIDRDGEMSKIKATVGLRISNSPSASTYIIENKIRKILEHYASDKPFKEKKRIDRMVTRLDKLAKVDLEYLFFLGTEESVATMIKTLSKTHNKINELSIKWKGELNGDE